MTRFLFSFFAAFILVLSFSYPSYATGDVKVGDTLPHDLNLKDSTGKERHFDDLRGKKGVTLVFIRSVEWCPFCQKQLIELSKNASKFEEAGYPVVSISYDRLPQMEKFVTKNKPKITLLSDPASESIRAFGILNESNAKGTMSYGIPHPGVYLVGADKKVQATFFEDGYKKRAKISELLTKIKELNPPPKPQVEDLEGLGEDPIVPGQDVITVPNETLEPVLSPVEEEYNGDSVAMPEADILENPAVNEAPANDFEPIAKPE